ncbi:MAG: hypothetical protein GQE15_34400 [Archangiaceae bacterium]|nr:hypothetical protein [Archangiaceae bacterium]
MRDTPGMDPTGLDQLVRRAVDAELKRRNRKLFSFVAVGLAVVGLGTAWRSFAQASCAQTLPSPLVTFCADAPAFAADVNGNFGALATTLQNRTGPLTAAGNGITTSGVSVTAAGRRGSFDGTELVMDTAARRGSAPDGGTRRALVHDANDTLTINYAADYTNGVALNSPFTVYGSQTVTGTLSQGCPTTYPIGGGAVTMVDMGVYCITQAAPAGMARNAVSWVEANEFCVSRGLRMCNFAEVSAAARLRRITLYPYAGGTRDTWTWVSQTATDNNSPGFGGCHVKLNDDHPAYPLGEINCAVDGFSRTTAIEGSCCF